MKSLISLFKSKIIVSSVVTAFVTVVLLHMGLKKKGERPPSVINKVEPLDPRPLKKAPLKKSKIKQKKKIKKTLKKKKYRGNKIYKIKKELDLHLLYALEDGENCKKNIEREIEGPSYVDPKSKKFHSVKSVFKKIDSLAASLVRSNSTEAYYNIEKLIFHKEFYKQGLSLAEVRSYLAKVEVCREPFLFNFLLSSVEAANDRNWNQKNRDILYNKISKYFLKDLKDFPSIVTLAYSVQYLKGLVLNDFIDHSYREEILILMSEVMDYQMKVMNSLSFENDQEDNLMILQEDFKQRKIFGKKIKGMFNRIEKETQYSSSY